MAEIRLICPGCAAEYRIPDAAIPPDGREVECSACGKVWFAAAAPARPDAADPPLPVAADAPSDLPRLNRRLPDTVLDILRDEVEHERRARVSEGQPGIAAPEPAGPRLVVDPEWPATTITRHVDPNPVATGTTALQPWTEPQPAPVQEPATSVEPEARAVATRDNPAPAPVAALPVPAPPPVRSGYGAGFGLAATLAAVLVALYVLAPSMADQGAFEDTVMGLRAQADEARLWLQDRAATLTR